MMLLISLCCALVLFVINSLPFWIGSIVCILLAQRVLEYVIVYSRIFIMNKGRVFTSFPNDETRGQWLIAMFTLALIQVTFVFAIWYHFISYHFEGSFANPLGIFNSLYFTLVTFSTTGYGDISPLSLLARIITSGQLLLSFFTILIVINGLSTIHFGYSKKVN